MQTHLFPYSYKKAFSSHHSFNHQQKRPHCDLQSQLSTGSIKRGWIMFTSQCSRATVSSIAANQQWVNYVVHLMPSKTLSEYEVVEKAIQLGNASSIIASHHFSTYEQHTLSDLAKRYRCQLFFTSNSLYPMH